MKPWALGLINIEKVPVEACLIHSARALSLFDCSKYINNHWGVSTAFISLAGDPFRLIDELEIFQ